jgi:hypothetical protein
MKALGGRGYIAATHSRPGRALPSGKGPPVPIVQEAGWEPCKVKVKQSLYTPWRRLGGEEYSSYSFSTSALDGGEWSASRPDRAFTPGERTLGTHCKGGWVGTL